MLKSAQKFPARTRRNSSVEEAMRSFERDGVLRNCWVAGRVVGILDDGFVLQDGSGRLECRMENREYRENPKSEIQPVSFGSASDIVRVAGGDPRMTSKTRRTNDEGRSGTHGVPLWGASFNVGDVLEVLLWGEWQTLNGVRAAFYTAKNLEVLVLCVSDFYIRREDPNYLKSVIDLRLKDFLEQRGKILKAVRDWFWSKDFLEVDTPSLVRLPGMEPYLDVFKTKFTGLPLASQKPKSEDLYLITSPEYAMKKLLVAGHEKIFQITKCFRNKEHESTLHNPEFTMLEWYRAYASYEDWMGDAEEMVTSLAKVFNVNLASACVKGWEKVKVKDLFKKYAGIEYEDFEDPKKFRKAVESIGYKVSGETPYEDLFFMVFLNEIEPKLGIERPTIVYEYPSRMAALAKKCEHDPRYAERAEIYINGMELANGFTELNDPVEQRERLEAERAERQKLKKDDYPVDQSFVRALEFGMPPSGGVALGIDRLVMLLTGASDIRDIISFPHRDL